MEWGKYGPMFFSLMKGAFDYIHVLKFLLEVLARSSELSCCDFNIASFAFLVLVIPINIFYIQIFEVPDTLTLFSEFLRCMFQSVSSSASTSTVTAAGTSEDEPLPPGWTMSRTEGGRVFFIDHNNRTTTWVRILNYISLHQYLIAY